MDNHRHKRHIQSSISAYFPNLPRTQSDISEHIPSAYTSLPPPLPAQIQSSLINVGMRVRKAVPEGYKTKFTHKTKHGETFQLDQYGTTRIVQAARLPRATSELAPFCGVHKIGGYSAQDDFHGTDVAYSSNAGLEVDDLLPATCFALTHDDEDLPLFSSQGSTASTLSTDSMPATRPLALPVRGKKRAMLEEEEQDQENQHWDELDCEFAETAGLMASSRLADLPRPSMNRAFATARRSARNRAAARSTPLLPPRETATMSVDFDEVDFLEMPGEMDGYMDLDDL